MKTLLSPTLRLILTAFLLSVITLNAFSADDPDELLNLYLETGLKEFADQIRIGFPESPQAKFCDAWEYLDANNQKARDLSEAMVLDHPDYAPGYFMLGTVKTTGFKEYSEAISNFNQSIDILPDFMLSYQYRGIAKIGLGDFEGAKEDFEEVQKMKRGYGMGFLLRGIANHGLGDNEDMAADFEIGLQLDYMALSKIPGDMADDAINQAIEAAPENAIYFFARGYAYFMRGNYRLASQDFSKCIELVPGSSDFYKYSGASKMQFDDYEGGQKDLNFALSVNPDDPETYYYLGVLMNDHIKQPAMAREYLNNAIELDDYHARYFYERSKAAYKMLDYNEALEDINTAIQLDHRKGDFYALRGNIKINLGDKKDVYCPDFRKAIEWGTSYNLKRVMKKFCSK
ncbi:tetratricopeptide repeat protein [Bacteroidota bacterium]